MTAPSKMSTLDVCNAISQLTVEETRQLVFQIGVPLRVLDSIADEYTGENRKQHFVQKWLDMNLDASWDKLVAGLRKMNMNTLAASVESEQISSYPLVLGSGSSFLLPTPSVCATAELSTPGYLETATQTRISAPVIPIAPVTATPAPVGPLAPVTATSAPVGPLTPVTATPAPVGPLAPVTATPAPVGPLAPVTDTPVPVAPVTDTRTPVTPLAPLTATPALVHPLAPVTAPVSPLAPVTDTPTPVCLLAPLTAPVSPLAPVSDTPAPVCLLAPVTAGALLTKTKVKVVKANIEYLEEEFSKLKCEARKLLSEREKKNQTFTDEFRDHLLDLPVAKKAIHIRFFTRNEDEILDAKNIRKLFAILGRYCNYSNYEIIFHVVKKYCHELKGRMTSYRDSLVVFEKSTTVDIYLCAISARPGGAITKEFISMTMKINKQPSECSLYEIRELNESIQEEAALEPYAMYIKITGEGSVRVSLHIHKAVDWMVGVVLLTAEFRQEHLLTEVTVKRWFEMNLMEYMSNELRSGSQRGDFERVMSLITAGVNVNVFDRDGDSALMWAARKGRTEVVSLLLEAGANTNLQNKIGFSPLMFAARKGGTEVVSLLLEAGANTNLQNKSGYSALMMAAVYGRTEVVSLLQEAGANTDLQNKNGESALTIAAREGRTEVVTLLVILDPQQNKGCELLMLASKGGELKTVNALITAGVDANHVNEDGDSPLMMAASNGRTEVVALLVKAGANTDLQNKDGYSALMMAASSWSETKVVPLLVKAGAALDLQNKEGDSAVIIATVRYHLPVLKELARAGADLNLQNQEGLTALMISSRSGRTDLTKILLSGRNISLDILSVTGWSALFFAVDNGDVATTKLLLKARADPFLGGHGLTAMDIASANAPATDPAPTHSLFRTRSAEGRRHRAMHWLLSKHMKKPSKQKVSPAKSSQEPLEPLQSAESSQEHPQSAESSLEHPQSAESSQEHPQSAESSHELAESQESAATRLSQSLLK
ncbi:Putative ankyrin repeat protein MM_0045, partial [Geodia barretti]